MSFEHFKVLPPSESRHCPLCHGANIFYYSFRQQRDYWSCRTCHLIFVAAGQYLPAKYEKARYDLHNNHPDDPDYRKFLDQMFLPMLRRLKVASSGLDFGSGPGPTLSLMFEEAGHTMANYDCYYAPLTSALTQSYDFITATEVVEHLHHPGFELSRLWTLLNPGGILGLMTQLVPVNQPFAKWYYVQDPTHVTFFSPQTCEWLAKYWQAELTYCHPNVMLFHKPHVTFHD